MRNIKREYGKLLSLLQAYAIVCTQVCPGFVDVGRVWLGFG